MNSIVQITFIASILALLLPRSLFCADLERDLKLTLDIPVEQIHPIEPLLIRLTIKNTRDQQYEGLGVWEHDHNYTTIEYRSANLEGWQPLHVPKLNMSSSRSDVIFEEGDRPGPYSPMMLNSGETRTAEFYVVYDPVMSYRFEKAIYYFDEYTEYELRAIYKAREGVEIVSNIDSFRVVPYDGVDQEAYEWLMTRKLPHFMYDNLFGPLSSATMEDFARDDAWQFLEKFPDTRFTPWVRFFLANAYTYSSLKVADEQRAKQFGDPEVALRELTNAEDPRLAEMAQTKLQELEDQRRRIRRAELDEIERERARQRQRQRELNQMPLAANDTKQTDDNDDADTKPAAAPEISDGPPWLKIGLGAVAVISLLGLVYVLVRYYQTEAALKRKRVES